MSTMEMNSATPEEDQNNSPSTLLEISTPINFAETTAADLGISAQSFIPPSLPSSNRKEKSRLAQLKVRRRSNIGVRGSPETNSLIRFMAQQRVKTPPAPSPLQLVRSSPFLPQVASSLRQKMASFQSLMGAEESEDASSGGSITRRDDLSDEGNLEAGKENHPPLMALPPNKKRRLGPRQGCEEQIREAPPLHFSLELEEEETPLQHKAAQSKEAEAVAEEPLSDAELWSPTEDQQEVVSELQKVPELGLTDPAAPSPSQSAELVRSPSISSLLEMKPTDCFKSPPVKKKRVRFGDPLPPEIFDKTLPPTTPLQKGGTPARAPTPGGALRSLLKTPQTPSAQHPDISPTFFGASPTLSMPRSHMTTSEDDKTTEKIPFPLDELEIESAFEESVLNAQPLNLNTAFNEESFSLIDADCEPQAENQSSVNCLSPEPLQEEDQSLQPQAEAEAQVDGSSRSSCRRRGKVTSDTSEAPARSSGRKRKLPEESEPAKRSSRAAAKTASGKMKASTAGRRWNKQVDRSLYGSREYASKNPSLSPIRERSSLGLSFDREGPLEEDSPASSLVPHPDLGCSGNSVCDDPSSSAVHSGNMTALNASTAPEDSLSSPPGAKRSGARRTRRLSGSKGRGRALKGRKVSVPHEAADEEVQEEDATLDTEKQWETEETTLNITIAADSVSDVACEKSATNLLEAEKDVNKESKSQATENVKSAQGEVESSQSSPADDKTNEIDRDEEQMQNHSENLPPCSDPREEEARPVVLQPWQDDFNLEDVFKPVPTRGQRSVRRSLRNRRSVDSSCGDAGSAWLPHTSPETIKEVRRRTRGRRLSAALLAPPLEDTQPDREDC